MPTSSQPLPGPEPGRDPAEVVTLILAALRRHGADRPDTAADTLHAFASPRMKSRIGDRADLQRALRNTRYAPLLDHRDAVVGPMERIGDSARQLVWIVSAGGERIPFLFALARQTRGEAEGCWLLSGLTREGIE